MMLVGRRLFLKQLIWKLFLFASICMSLSCAQQEQNFFLDNICLDKPKTSNETIRYLEYPDGSLRPVQIPYSFYTSSKISAHIHQILLSEALRFSTILVNIQNESSELQSIAGCVESSLTVCRKWDITNPKLHFSLESVVYPNHNSLPANAQPQLLNVLSYNVDDGYYIWNRVREAGKQGTIPAELTDYGSYNASLYAPHTYFDRWSWMLDEIPQLSIATCSEIFSGALPDGLSARPADAISTYSQLTNDIDLSCHADRVWFSPACRRNTSLCVPLVVLRHFDWAMQRAALLNMPLAVALLRTDPADPASPVRPAVLRGRLLFQARLPADTLFDVDGAPPALLRLPRQDAAAQARGDYRSGTDSARARTYGWRYLSRAGPAVRDLLSRVDLTDADVAGFMARSAALRAAGAGPDAAARRVACEWVRGAGAARWPAWISPACLAGSYPDDSLGECLPCPAGSYCPDGTARPTTCPADCYCPAGASEPVPCPDGRGSVPTVGAAEPESCQRCPAGALAVVGPSCVAVAVLVPAVLLPLVAVGAAAAAWWRMRRGAQSQRALRRRVAALRARLGLERRDGYFLR